VNVLAITGFASIAIAKIAKTSRSLKKSGIKLKSIRLKETRRLLEKTFRILIKGVIASAQAVEKNIANVLSLIDFVLLIANVTDAKTWQQSNVV
jgi:hypothetical protein